MVTNEAPLPVIDIDRFDVNEDVEMSKDISLLASALAAAQGMMGAAEKDSTNPHFKSKYASLAAIIDASKSALFTHGLSICQVPGGKPPFITITTILMHKSGQWISGRLVLKSRSETPQDMGSAITYGRRYALSSMLRIAADEDDDGNKASFASSSQNSQYQPPPTGAQYNLAPPPTHKTASDSYTISFGKFKNKRLTELNEKDIRSYIEFLRSMAVKENKPLGPAASEFISQAESYLNATTDFEEDGPPPYGEPAVPF